MVKADVKRDYYGDLELKPGADILEVKKQFKKLALKYHPDRNPGRESEFNAKFQAIQAAHEILTDELAKAKYDSDRKRQGYWHQQSPFRARPTPTRAAYSSPEPPPRPRPTPTAKASYSQTHPEPAGWHSTTDKTKPSWYTTADRYARYRSADAQWQSAKDDVRAKATAKAWGRMRRGPYEHEGTAKSTASGRNEDSYAPRPRPSFENFNQAKDTGSFSSRARAQNAKKKNGFDPATADGDEPPARNTSAYFHIHRQRREYMDTDEHATPPASPARSRGTSPSKFPSTAFVSEECDESMNGIGSARQSTPYASKGGERIYVPSFGLGRSASVKNTQKKSAPEPHVHERPHSAKDSSRRHSANAQHMKNNPFYDTTSSEEENEEILHTGPAKRRAASKDGGKSSFREEKFQSRSEKPKAPPEDDRSKSTPNSSGKDGPSTSKTKTRGDKASQADKGSKAFPKDSTNSQSTKDKPTMYASRADKPSSPASPVLSTPSRKPNLFPMDNVHATYTSCWQYPSSVLPPKNLRETYPHSSKFSQTNAQTDQTQTFYTPKCSPTSTGQQKSESTDHFLHPQSYNESQNAIRKHAANFDFLTRFTFPFDPKIFDAGKTHNLRSHSTDNINTKFSPTEFNGPFKGVGEKYFAAHPEHMRTSRSRDSLGSNFFRHPLMEQNGFLQTTMPFVSGHTKAETARRFQNQRQKFSAEKWAETVRQESFFTANAPSISPTRANIRRPKSPRKAKHSPISMQPTVSEAMEKEDAVPNAGSNDTNGRSEPDGTTDDGNQMDIDPPMATSEKQGNAQTPQKAAGSQSDQVDGQNPVSVTPPKRPAANSQSSSQRPAKKTSDSSKMNLDGLGNVAPFATNKEGLQNLSDLNDSLPFKSRASNTVESELEPRYLDLPSPPKAPIIPEPLNNQTATAYFSKMEFYLQEWNKFNARMLQHFNARQAEAEASVESHWVGSVGVMNYSKYIRGMKEDVRVRAHWDISWDKHLTYMKAYGEVRANLSKKNGIE